MDWDDAKYFLAVARDGQMLGAARRLGVSQARLSRRIGALEATLGTRLLDRTTRGCTLTVDGAAMLEAAAAMESALTEGRSRLSAEGGKVAGTVRIGAPDGFGTGFLAPRLTEFTARYPGLALQLVPVPRTFSLSQREADIAIMIGRPEKGRLKARKLTDYTLSVYGARAYLDRAGAPADGADLARHRVVGYVEDMIHTPALAYTSELLPESRPDIEIATALGQLAAVRAGAGIGVLHDFMAAGDADLVRLFPERRTTREYWTVWHEDLTAARRITATVDLLATLARNERKLFLPTR